MSPPGIPGRRGDCAVLIHDSGVTAASERTLAGQHYFTRLTIIYTGSRSYRAGGKLYYLPATTTYPLSAYGGA